ncbi:MAG: SEC-C domain-containing protein [Candidatus Methylomirabilis sp.]|nr:SEC-C domain-containing protein [Deltaproteobacteria bacterium]
MTFCPCGSVKKFKKCCMSGQASRSGLPGMQEITDEIKKEFVTTLQALSPRLRWLPIAS